MPVYENVVNVAGRDSNMEKKGCAPQQLFSQPNGRNGITEPQIDALIKQLRADKADPSYSENFTHKNYLKVFEGANQGQRKTLFLIYANLIYFRLNRFVQDQDNQEFFADLEELFNIPKNSTEIYENDSNSQAVVTLAMFRLKIYLSGAENLELHQSVYGNSPSLEILQVKLKEHDEFIEHAVKFNVSDYVSDYVSWPKLLESGLAEKEDESSRQFRPQ